MSIKQIYYFFSIVIIVTSCIKTNRKPIGYTEIEQWKDGKKTAVSLTYDGGTTNQFRVALPIMNRHGFPATFFIVTGEVKGSSYERKFIGRPLEVIVRESAEIPTNSDNFFERASAIRVLGDETIIEYHTRAGDLWEVGKFEEAYEQIVEAYTKVRSYSGPISIHENQQKSGANWDELKTFTAQGHEFASHSVSHAQFGILDDVNLIYELEKSKEEIINHLGPKHTFSIECPYGTENERVMEFTLARYEASRNRMPEPFLEEINRWNKMSPGTSEKEYVQWQRGPKSATPLEEMITWIDSCTTNDNIWLVLVFHGIEGIGWEPVPRNVIDSYFNYIKSIEKDIWVATFQDVTKYIRERMRTRIDYIKDGDQIRIRLSHSLDPELYDLPLTLKTYIPETWESVEFNQEEKRWFPNIDADESGHYVLYEALPNNEEIILEKK
jgi:peptidoglycan/xylan/chitin deacetylase (PgdA/CDA1 family)